MKIFGAGLTFAVAIVTVTSVTKVHWRIDRVYCNSSGISVFPNHTCKVKLISRDLSYLSMNFDFRPNLPVVTNYKTMVYFKWAYKSETGQNYRTVIELKKMDFCAMAKVPFDPTASHFSDGIQYIYNFMNGTLGGMWKKCPMKSFTVTNMTFANYVNHKNEASVNEHTHLQPNGKYLFIVRAFSAADDNLLTFVIFSTFKVNGNNWEF